MMQFMLVVTLFVSIEVATSELDFGVRTKHLRELSSNLSIPLLSSLSNAPNQSFLNSKWVNVSSLETFQNSEEYPSLKEEAMEALLSSYIETHSEDVLIGDSNLCGRRFIVGSYGCNQIAKRLDEFLVTLMSAVISNQTFLADFCEDEHVRGRSTNRSSCTIGTKTWVPSAQRVVIALREKGCTEKAQTLEDQINQSSCSFGKLNVSEFYGQNKDSIALNTLGAYGPDAAIGALFRFSLEFQESVLISNDQIMNSSMVIGGMGRERAFVIGIHARHANEIVQTGFVKYVEEKDCIKHVLLDSRPKFGDRHCVIVVSTDRNHTMIGLATFANTLGCEVLNAKEKKEKAIDGDLANDGFAMTADLELLSQSDFFLGSTQGNELTRTSFSSLVASLVALKHRGSQNVLWIPSENCNRDTIQAAIKATDANQMLNNATDISVSNQCNPKFISDLNNKAIKGSRGREVFLIRNCSRHSIPDWDTFLAMKIPEWDITVLDDQKLKVIELGPPLARIVTP